VRVIKFLREPPVGPEGVRSTERSEPRKVATRRAAQSLYKISVKKLYLCGVMSCLFFRSLLVVLGLLWGAGATGQGRGINTEAAELLSGLTKKPFYASDGWVDLYKTGAIRSGDDFYLFEKGVKKTAQKINKNTEAVSGAGAPVRLGEKPFKNTIKYIDNYKVTSTGKIAEIIGENGDVLGTLYKQSKYVTDLQYSYKYKASNGNFKTENLISYINRDLIEFDFNIPNELKGQGLGSIVLEDAVKYYNIKSPTYKGIRGRWESGNPNYVDGISDNFKAFKDATLANKTPEQAAFETWTGKQAQKHGFKKAKVVTDDNNLVIIEFTE
jgi:hypothetical protein